MRFPWLRRWVQTVGLRRSGLPSSGLALQDVPGPPIGSIRSMILGILDQHGQHNGPCAAHTLCFGMLGHRFEHFGGPVRLQTVAIKESEPELSHSTTATSDLVAAFRIKKQQNNKDADSKFA